MRVVVDLARCQSYGQCVFEAPDVFRFPAAETLEFDYVAGDSRRVAVLGAQAACPVAAIVTEFGSSSDDGEPTESR